MALKKQPLAKTNVLQNSFKFRIIDAWNRLPETLVTDESLSNFKLNIRKLPLERFLREHAE